MLHGEKKRKLYLLYEFYATMGGLTKKEGPGPKQVRSVLELEIGTTHFTLLRCITERRPRHQPLVFFQPPPLALRNIRSSSGHISSGGVRDN